MTSTSQPAGRFEATRNMPTMIQRTITVRTRRSCLARRATPTSLARLAKVPLIAVVVVLCVIPQGVSSHEQAWRSTASITRGGSQSSISSSSSPFGPLGARKAQPLRRNNPEGRRSFSTTAITSSNQQQQQQQQQQADRAATKEMMDAFLTRDSRNTFIARVYAILSGQLLVTAASVCLFGLNPNWSAWMRQPHTFGGSVPYLSLGLSTICWFIMCLSDQARRSSPLKWQLLILFTLGEALSVGFISSFYTFASVVTAMVATAAAATSISLYTVFQKNSKYDLSMWGASLSSAGLIFCVYGLISLFQMIGVIPAGLLPYNDVIFSCMGACLFSVYLAHHTKLIVSGKHNKYQMNEKDYVFGALALYNDIINMFLYLLRLLGEDREPARGKH